MKTRIGNLNDDYAQTTNRQIVSGGFAWSLSTGDALPTGNTGLSQSSAWGQEGDVLSPNVTDITDDPDWSIDDNNNLILNQPA